ncbi:Fur family transcriptional regulator [Euzebya rosea]|uniref:Fur family transcriptional regulator n=1 Tax=Euzebya rosea TaxID=2052804 RepID=UPI000D3E23BE|nr:Fur family transcriptional regulator [Euzebya rosea]
METALREAGLRVTRQRLAVLEALKERTDALSAQDVWAEFRERGETIGLSTVYRTLESLQDVGLLDSFDRDGEQAYRFCSTSHHHHLVCLSCNEVEELRAEIVEEWVGRVSEAHGFEVTAHRADIYGHCAGCSG